MSSQTEKTNPIIPFLLKSEFNKKQGAVYPNKFYKFTNETNLRLVIYHESRITHLIVEL